MDPIFELLKLLLPAAIVLYAMFLSIKAFLNKETDKMALSIKQKSSETVLPIRLQAYERICLLLERISPHNLVLRLNNGELTGKAFQQVLVGEIREEFNHNLSQQLYMSDKSWEMVRSAVEQLSALINDAGSEIDDQASSLDLAKIIFQKTMNWETDPIQLALSTVKEEIREIF